MIIEVGRKYKAKANIDHHFYDGEVIELIRDGFAWISGTEGTMGHFVSTERETDFVDQVLEYDIDVEEIENA